MAASLNINDILSQIKKLDKEDQLNLLQRLVLLLKKTEVSKNTSIYLSSLSGLGSEIWRDTDMDSYVEGERQWPFRNFPLKSFFSIQRLLSIL